MDYPLCDQTVTLYRPHADGVLRQVLEGCYLEVTSDLRQHDRRLDRKFLLLVPGACQRVFPGDHLIPGNGPQDFDPHHPELLTVHAVTRFFLHNTLTHIEAT